MAELRPELRDALALEDWGSLTEGLVKVVEAQLKKLRWRGTKEGVLPDGCDAEGIANEAIGELFAGNARLELAYTPADLQEELDRLVHQQVDRLHRRKENLILRNRPDLARLRTKDGERPKVEETVPDEGAAPDSETMELEREEQLARFRNAVGQYFGGDREALAVFGCVCSGVTRREEIAAQLAMEPSQVKNARKRMDRMLKAFALNGGKEICDALRSVD